MSFLDPRPQRRPKRPRALVLTCLVAVASTAAVPSSASAFSEGFCGSVGLNPGDNCFASNRHNVLQVSAASLNSYDRVCAATFTAPLGSQNSNWVCDYGTTLRDFGGARVSGVGAVHNGDPQFFYTTATQEY